MELNNNSNIFSIEIGMQHVFQLINDLTNEQTRGNALEGLKKYREAVPDLAVYIWYSFGTATSLLMEVINVYPSLCFNSLNVFQINRLCNVLSLLQCVADHVETRREFAKAQVPYYLVPFMKVTSQTTEYENLRLMTLGVFGSWIKSGDHDVIRFMLSSDFVPSLLTILKVDKELSKTVACFILQNILANQEGLSFLCQTYDRFYEIALALDLVVKSLTTQPSSRLLKHTIRCYRMLVNCERARDALRSVFPSELRDPLFYQLNGLRKDRHTLQWLQEIIQLLSNSGWGT